MAAEKNFENQIKDFLKSHGAWYVKYWGGGGYTKSGVPDILVSCYGFFMGIEVKGPRGHPSDLQLYHLRQIDGANGYALLLYPDSWELFKKFIELLGKYRETEEKRCKIAADAIYHTLSQRWRHQIIEESEAEDMAGRKKIDVEAEMRAALDDTIKSEFGKLPPEMLEDPEPEEPEPQTEANPVKNEIEGYLSKTRREGIEDLMDYMDAIGFYTAPCSGGNHNAEEGGLARHSLNVLHMAEKISVACIGGKNITDDMRSSIAICALLHDLGKCGDHGKPLYVPNVLKSGKASEAKPYKRNPELSNVPHSIRSVIIATRWIDLTEDEEYAILYHDGLYDRETGGMSVLPGHETPLSLIIHWADMWASHIIECSTDKESEV